MKNANLVGNWSATPKFLTIETKIWKKLENQLNHWSATDWVVGKMATPTTTDYSRVRLVSNLNQ